MGLFCCIMYYYMNYKKYAVKVVLATLLLGVGVGLGYQWGFNHEHDILVKSLNVIHPLRDHNPSYKFVSPLLAYIVPSADQDAGLTALKNKVADFIDVQKKSNNLSDASVYLSDLNRGRWIGVNERQKYNPASMLKVVVMVSYFKEAEIRPDILRKNLMYTASAQEAIKKDFFNSSSQLEIGQWYTIQDLIEKMIVDSDNGAELLLFGNINKDNLDAIYNVLNITSPDKMADNFVISPRAYSLFFRVIYSATYLNEDLSEKALSILSKTTFDDGIVAGLSTNLVVSHKFGEHVESSNNQVTSVELHDCGIVYYPVNPYFLCVMTKGKDIDQLKSVIKNISSMVYQAYGSQQ